MPNLREAADERERLTSFERVPNMVCEVCARPLPGLARKEGEPLLCPACHDKTYAFDRARSFALHVVQGGGGAGDSAAEIRAHRAVGGVV
jgi:hypothetical protein